MTEIQAWEADSGRILPDDYKSFMVRHNGGFVFPEFFALNYPAGHAIYDELQQSTRIEDIFNWKMFEKENAFEINDWNPQEYVAVGAAIDGTILIRIAPDDHGAVRYWWRNNPVWDEPGGDEPTGRIADSFRDLLMNRLHEGSGPSSRWDRESYFQQAQRLDF